MGTTTPSSAPAEAPKPERDIPAELRRLRADIGELDAKADTLPDGINRESAEFSQMKERVDRLLEEIEAAIAYCREKKDSAQIAELQKLPGELREALKGTVIGGLFFGLDEADPDGVDAAEGAPAMPAEAPETTGAKGLEESAAPEAIPDSDAPDVVDDVLTPEEFAEQEKEATAGLGFVERTKFLFDLWMKFQPVILMMKKFGCKDQACKDEVDAQAAATQEIYDQLHGKRDVCERFTALFQKRGITVRPGGSDDTAFAYFKTLEADPAERTKAGLSEKITDRNKLISAITRRYFETVGTNARAGEVLTLSGILDCKSTKKSPDQNLLRADPKKEGVAEVVLNDAEKYQVFAQGGALVVNGRAWKLRALGDGQGTELVFSQMDFTKSERDGKHVLSFTISKPGKLFGVTPLAVVTLDTPEKIQGFFKTAAGSGGKLPQFTAEQSAMLGFGKSKEFIVELVPARAS
ncbi:MAG: hypothetical protein WCX61_01290 [Candidatus Peribacteraceae bacterium]